MKIEKKILDYIHSHEKEMIDLWEKLVYIESQSQCREGVNELAAHIDTYCSAMGLDTKKYIFEKAGPSLVAFTEEKELGGIILMAHIDTVHPKGSFGTNLFKCQESFVYGPGVYDCKGGIVVALFTIRSLQSIGYNKRQIKLILSGDEEVAHELSDGQGIEVYKNESKECIAAFNCESGLMNGDVITRRKGGGVVKIIVTGIASHAGNAPKDGASAIKEAAYKILDIEKLTNFEGTTFNCGKITGGVGSNVIPEHCEFEVGIRFHTNKDYETALNQLRKICESNYDPLTNTKMEVITTFKAMEITEKTDSLFKIYQNSCEELGFSRPDSIYSGGCSDAAYIATEGIPVLCGLGVRGSGNHSKNERAVKSSLVEQTKKLVQTIINLPDDF